MTKLALTALGIILAATAATSIATPAEARVSVGIGIGGGGYYGGGYGGGYYGRGYAPYYSPYYYGYPAYYAPGYYGEPAPTVIYEQPAQPPVTYVQPQAQYQQPQQPYPQQYQEEQAPPASATQTSNTFTDHQGRTCRQFKSTLEDGTPVNGTACRTSDGNWHTVE